MWYFCVWDGFFPLFFPYTKTLEIENTWKSPGILPRGGQYCEWVLLMYGMEQFIRLCMGISNFTVVTVNEIKELWLAWSVACVFFALWWRSQAISTNLSPSVFPSIRKDKEGTSSHPLQESAINSGPKLQTPLNPTNTTINSHPNHFLTKLVCNLLSFGLKGMISATTPSLLVQKRRVLRDRATPTVFNVNLVDRVSPRVNFYYWTAWTPVKNLPAGRPDRPNSHSAGVARSQSTRRFWTRRDEIFAEIMSFSPKDNRLQTSLAKKWLGWLSIVVLVGFSGVWSFGPEFMADSWMGCELTWVDLSPSLSFLMEGKTEGLKIVEMA